MAECPHCPGVGVAMGDCRWAIHIQCGKPFIRQGDTARVLDEKDISAMGVDERTMLAKMMREFARG